MASDEPTLGEALRRLDDVSKKLDGLAGQLAEDRRDFASTYVPRELYDTRHAHLGDRITELSRRLQEREDEDEAREKSNAAFRRQLLLIVLAPAIPALGAFLLSLFILLANQGNSPVP
jgi:chromosome segregation ATPase